MNTTETIKRTVSVEERLERLAQSVGGFAVLQEMATKHGVEDGITVVEATAISTTLFHYGQEPIEVPDELNPYAKVRAGFLLVDVRSNPAPRDIALAGLFSDLRQLRDTSELITLPETYPLFSATN